MKCRSCKESVNFKLVDLGSTPVSNSLVSTSLTDKVDPSFPLVVYVCENCWLVQLDEHTSARNIFDDSYVYHSSFSSSWVEHSKNFVDSISDRLSLDSSSFVVEIGSNDGYLLEHFKNNVPVLGVEPSTGPADVARSKGIQTVTEYFSETVAEQLIANHRQADLVVANNVVAHCPDLHDFLSGISVLLQGTGVFSAEFPHLGSLIDHVQFDTIYHEHFSYFSLTSYLNALQANGLYVFDLEVLRTHGGSLRVYASKTEQTPSQSVKDFLELENSKGVSSPEYYKTYSSKVQKVVHDFKEFLLDMKNQNKTVVGYGAAAKASTLLNVAGITPDLLPMVADKSPYKQGKLIPGCRVPIVAPEQINSEQPEYVVVFPWNIKDEIVRELKELGLNNSSFVTAIPALSISS